MLCGLMLSWRECQMQTYKCCFKGDELVSWLVDHNYGTTDQALIICSTLLTFRVGLLSGFTGFCLSSFALSLDHLLKRAWVFWNADKLR